MKPILERLSWVAAIAAIVVGAASCWTDLEALEELDRDARRLRERYGELATLAINLDEYRRQYRELDDAFGVLLQWLPNAWTADMGSGAVESVRDEAGGFKLRAVSVALGAAERRGESIATRRVDVSAAGNFRDLVSYLQWVSIASGRLRTIEYVALAREADGRGLAMVAELRVHGMEAQEDAPKAKGRER